MATFRQVVASGDRAAALRALRDQLASALLEAPAYSRAPLARQIREVMAELEQFAEVEVADPIDEITARRAARQSAAETGTASGGADKRRKRSG